MRQRKPISTDIRMKRNKSFISQKKEATCKEKIQTTLIILARRANRRVQEEGINRSNLCVLFINSNGRNIRSVLFNLLTR